MWKQTFSTLLCWLIAFLLAAPWSASGQTAIPRTVTHQGLLTDASTGNPVADAIYSVTFRLYKTAAGGAAIWTETQSVTTTDGVYDAILGTVTPLDSVYFNGELWLSVQVAPDAEMTDRTELTSVPYAMGLALPFTDTVASDVPLFQLNNSGTSDGILVTNTGFGTAGAFLQQHVDSGHSGVYAQTDGGGAAVYGKATGNASAGRFENTSLNNPSPVIHTETMDEEAPDIHATGYIKATRLEYNAPRTGFASIHGSAFQPTNQADGITWRIGSGFFYTGSSVSDTAFSVTASIQLPHDAELQSMSCLIDDGTTSENLSCRLCRRTGITAGCFVLGTVTSNDVAGGLAEYSTAVTPISVDNDNESYFVSVFTEGATDWASYFSDLIIVQVSVRYRISEAP